MWMSARSPNERTTCDCQIFSNSVVPDILIIPRLWHQSLAILI